jgi:DNA-binding transcriptional ArsR family regulator
MSHRMGRGAGEDETFRAVADGSRRMLLGALAEGPKSFQDLHALLPVTKSAVSQHLAMLIAAGLVSVDVAADRRRTYVLVPEPLQEIDDWVDQYRHFWTRYLEGLGQAMRRHRASRPQTTSGGRS